MPYSMEYRVAVANAYDECGSSIEVADMFSCSEAWVRRLIQRRRDTGSLACKPPRLPDNHKLDAAELEKVRTLIQQRPDMTLAELVAALDHKIGITTAWRTTRRLKLTRKKSPSTPASRPGPTSPPRVPVGSTPSAT